jgi:probable F420-dependent oxidoreductase
VIERDAATAEGTSAEAQHPFRFGIQAANASSAQEWRDLARMVEDLGYSTLLVPDHFTDTDGVLAPAVAVSFAAAATSTLRVGYLVLGNDYKHPAVVAKESATIDLLSDGRLELGLGAGWLIADYERLGLTYDPPGIRVDRLEEAIAVVKGCLSGERFDFQGEHYRISAYGATPRPLQQPHPPLLIGGGGPRVLRLAGREADIVGINPNMRAGAFSPDAGRNSIEEMTRKKVEWIREGAGGRFDDLEIQLRGYSVVTDDARGVAEAVGGHFGLEPDEALDSAMFCIGTVDEVCDRLIRRREQWGVSYNVFGERDIEAFAPVVSRLAGK